MTGQKLTLSAALETDRLEAFIAQVEADGVGSVDERELMEALRATIKPPRSEDRTSRSPSRDGSTGK